MTYQEFKMKHDMANAMMCADHEDVMVEVKHRKAIAFQAFMKHMDTHHPRKKASTMPANRTHRTNIVAYLRSAVNRICR